MASADNTQYVYQPLPTLRSVRLLKVLPSSLLRPSQLSCSLETFDNDTRCPSYLAISYTWGPPFDTHECFENYGPKNDRTISLVESSQHGEHARTQTTKLSSTAFWKQESEWRSLKIGRNLYEALLSIKNLQVKSKLAAGIEHIWCDAICINQQDPEERRDQVLLMDRIFSRATTVIIWLGKRTEGMRHVRQFHDGRFNNAVRASNARYQSSGYLESLSDPHKRSVTISGHKVRKDALRRLISFYVETRWFQRTWTLQEAALAQEAILLSDSFITNLATVGRIATFLRHHDRICEEIFAEESSRTWRSKSRWALSDGITNVQRMVQGVQMHEATVRGSNRQLRVLEHCYGAITPTTRFYAYLELLLEYSSSFGVLDPRDRIYALLGMANRFIENGSEHLIVPSYTKPVEEMFLSTAQKCLQNLPYLTALSLVQGQQARDSTETALSLPSWVPDYTMATNHRPLLLSQRMRAFNVQPGGRNDWPLLRFNGTRLSLQGRRCEAITRTFLMRPERYFTEPHDGVREIAGAEALIELCTEANEAYENGQLSTRGKVGAIIDLLTLSEVNSSNFQIQHKQFQYFLCDLLASGLETPMPASTVNQKRESLLSSLDEMNGYSGLPTRMDVLEIVQARKRLRGASSSELRKHQKLQNEARRFLDAFENTCGFRKPFLTSNNILGLSSLDARTDDEVWLLNGARVPFILRPTANRGDYLLIGECYVQGGMHGALITSGIAGEEQEITLV